MAACVYAIKCPITKSVVYVGRTLDSYSRFIAHRKNKENTLIGIWMRNILSKGLKPEFEILEEVVNVPTDFMERKSFCKCKMDELEFKWMFFYLKAGADLLNMKRGAYPEKLTLNNF